LKQLSVNTTSIEKLVEALKLSQESQMNTLIQAIAELNANVLVQTKTQSELNANIVLQTKHQTLEWAISNAELTAFTSYKKGGYQSHVLTDSLVRTILMFFRQGLGCYIENHSLTPYQDNAIEKNEEGEKNFRDALSTQVHNLTGQKPRIAMYDGRYAIYYS
jgi:hypothetical protein